jgi:GIY-YIG catalytic domain
VSVPERRQVVTPAEVEAALEDLDLRPHRIQATSWPGGLTDLAKAGLYSWWVDESGAADLSAGLGMEVIVGRIYAGQTGATRWPSGTVVTSTLSGRIGGNHLRGNVRGSTFRRTLAAVLWEPRAFAVSGPARLNPSSEKDLSEWMRLHLEVAVHRFAERDSLADLEHHVLARLDPPLNLEGMPATSIRMRLAELRAALTHRGVEVISTTSRGSSPAPTFRPATQRAEHRSSFTRAEIDQLGKLVEELRRADSGRQKTIRAKMRRIGFYITDYLPDQSGFTRSDLDDLIERQIITIADY